VIEKRMEMRIPLMARVHVLWADEDGAPRVAPATLEDRSHSGVSVLMKSQISAGSHVIVKSGTLQYSGTVTNCRPERGSYVIGVKLDDRGSRDRK
jgi:hypothetical protein